MPCTDAVVDVKTESDWACGIWNQYKHSTTVYSLCKFPLDYLKFLH